MHTQREGSDSPLVLFQQLQLNYGMAEGSPLCNLCGLWLEEIKLASDIYTTLCDKKKTT